MAKGIRARGDQAVGASGCFRVQALAPKVCQPSPLWVAAGCLVISLALFAAPAGGAEVTISREVTVHGENLGGQLAQPLAKMKEQLMSQGCKEFSVAFWTVGIPSRVRVEVRCLGWRGEGPLPQWF
ncbi:MAG: hypothetical protein ACE5JD_13430 [Candidatus Methylomirabilia bacterium]